MHTHRMPVVVALGALAVVAATLLTPGTATAATTVVVAPDTGLVGGQTISITVSGLTPGVLAGWCQGVPVVAPSDTSGCGTATTSTQIVALDGTIVGTTRVERWLYVPALGRWVDCADPAETCTIGAAEAADIAGTAGAATIVFADPPAAPPTRGTVAATPSTGLTDGDAIAVTGTGFRPDTVVELYQCPPGTDSPTDPSGCSYPIMATTTDPTGAFSSPFPIAATITPPGGAPYDCRDRAGDERCRVAAAEGPDFVGTFAATPVEIVTPPPVVPRVVPGGVWVQEADSGSTELHLPVALSEPTTVPVTASWETVFVPGAPGAQAEPDADYTSNAGTVLFAPGETQQTVDIAVLGDVVDEPDEYFVVKFSNPTNAVMGGFWGLGFGGIRDDEPLVTILPGASAVVEGHDGTATVSVPVRLSGPSSWPITATWTTKWIVGAPDYQADPDADYTPASGTVSFAPGETVQYVAVEVVGDTVDEPEEYVVLIFSDPTNARMGGFWGLGFGLIVDDD